MIWFVPTSSPSIPPSLRPTPRTRYLFVGALIIIFARSYRPPCFSPDIVDPLSAARSLAAVAAAAPHGTRTPSPSVPEDSSSEMAALEERRMRGFHGGVTRGGGGLTIPMSPMRTSKRLMMILLSRTLGIWFGSLRYNFWHTYFIMSWIGYFGVEFGKKFWEKVVWLDYFSFFGDVVVSLLCNDGEVGSLCCLHYL